MDHSENLMKVKRAQSAYKRHLAAKLVEKGSRGRDISERHKKLSEYAKKTSEEIGLHYNNEITNMQEMQRNHALDLNARIIYQDISKKK